LETYVGGPHLVRRARRALAAGQRSSLQKLFRKDPDLITAATLSVAADKGDALARLLWDRAGHALGLALGSLIYVLNPDQVWFTGGIAQAGDLILKPMQRVLDRRTFKTPMRAVSIRIARNAPNIGVVGAALL
jgi:glucokinase